MNKSELKMKINEIVRNTALSRDQMKLRIEKLFTADGQPVPEIYIDNLTGELVVKSASLKYDSNGSFSYNIAGLPMQKK